MTSTMTYKSLMSPFYRAVAWAGMVNLNEELWFAASRGDSQKVKAILMAGADVHADEDDALRVAAAGRHTDTVRALLEAGADVHAQEDVASWWARQHSDSDMVRTLSEFMACEERKQSSTVLQPG